MNYTHKEVIELIKAHKEGKKLECQWNEQQWMIYCPNNLEELLSDMARNMPIRISEEDEYADLREAQKEGKRIEAWDGQKWLAEPIIGYYRPRNFYRIKSEEEKKKIEQLSFDKIVPYEDENNKSILNLYQIIDALRIKQREIIDLINKGGE